MTKLWMAAILALLTGLAGAGQDDFRREGERAYKDTLEGKAPPALRVGPWMNASADDVSWEALRGKVVLVDFWGTW